MMRCFALIVTTIGLLTLMTDCSAGWLDGVLAVPYRKPAQADRISMQLMRQDYEQLEINQSVVKTPLTIGKQHFEHGLGTHSVGHIRIHSREPIVRFQAWVGVDVNARTSGGTGSVEFAVRSGDKQLYRSGVLRPKEDPVRVDIDTGGAGTLDLMVGDAGDGPACDHADWAEATITLAGGKTMLLNDIKPETSPDFAARYPFSFTYGGKLSDDVLDGWKAEKWTEKSFDEQTKSFAAWTDPQTGLKLTWEAVRFADYPALEWVLYLENTGKADTPIIHDLLALDLTFSTPLSQGGPYILHRTNGAPSNPTDYEVSAPVIDPSNSATMGGGGGRSSNKDFPFFKVETGAGSAIIAVGWSGQWKADVECPDSHNLHVTAGLEKTHFLLHPGEKVRSPRMLIFWWEGDTLESNAQFRQLIYKHYAAKRAGKTPLPIPFINTCFTRGGGWLNECNEANQISLIKAYAPLGIEALITDAGWFEGGWPEGAGNWGPRKDAYPNGMRPVAAAAREHGMVYGLWYEPERVVTGTDIYKTHPEWCLTSRNESESYHLLNFGLPEVQDYFFNIVRPFMELPGFRFYRQDFNMDPLPFWLHNDAPDRQGMTEMKYVEGLYAYWDRIRSSWPDCYMEECASGGRRIDLETVKRMHLHQESDYWFDNETDQNQIWGLAQYLPNGLFDTPLVRLDDYSFHSTMACSLIPSWIADEPGFDTARAKKLMDRYLEVRHLLVGAWYPLLPQSMRKDAWITSQYHRPDLNEGMIVAIRRPESPYRTVEVALHGLDPNATYELKSDATGATTRAKGSDLMKSFEITIDGRQKSDLITYRKFGTTSH